MSFLSIESQPSKQFEELLSRNVIGTPGLSMLYRHMGVKQKLYRIAKPHVISVQRNGVLMGACCFCEREVDGVTGFYVRYFAFQDGFRLKVLNVQRQQKKVSAIRSEIQELLAGKGLVSDTDKRFFHYAYVDPRNPRSARLCEEFGFVPVRQYTTQLFSRLWPKKHPHLSIKELPAIDARVRSLLTSFYKDYQHVSFENLQKTWYYMENEAGEIVAGAHVNPDAWQITALPGRNGKALLAFFNRMPLLSRLLSKHFRFLAVEGIYYQEGKEKLIEHLLETLLHHHSLHTAIMVTDTDSSLYRMTQRIKLGLLAKLSPRVYGNVIIYNHPDDTTITQQKSRPAYISVHDVS